MTLVLQIGIERGCFGRSKQNRNHLISIRNRCFVGSVNLFAPRKCLKGQFTPSDNRSLEVLSESHRFKTRTHSHSSSLVLFILCFSFVASLPRWFESWVRFSFEWFGSEFSAWDRQSMQQNKEEMQHRSVSSIFKRFNTKERTSSFASASSTQRVSNDFDRESIEKIAVAIQASDQKQNPPERTSERIEERRDSLRDAEGSVWPRPSRTDPEVKTSSLVENENRWFSRRKAVSNLNLLVKSMKTRQRRNRVQSMFRGDRIATTATTTAKLPKRGSLLRKK